MCKYLVELTLIGVKFTSYWCTMVTDNVTVVSYLCKDSLKKFFRVSTSGLNKLQSKIKVEELGNNPYTGICVKN